MESITIGQIAGGLAFIVALVGSIEFLSVRIKKQVNNILEPLNKHIKDLDIGACKNFLVRFLGDVEKGEKLDESEIERAYEVYDHYTNDLHQNSYIHKRWNELMEKSSH